MNYKDQLLSIYPLPSITAEPNKNLNIVIPSKKVIGYDFDGVLHRSMSKYDPSGQGHPNVSIDNKVFTLLVCCGSCPNIGHPEVGKPPESLLMAYK